MAKKLENNKQVEFVFGKQNYIILGAALAVIIFGFILMSGGGSDNPNEFSEEIFNFRRITLAPIVILIGYGLVVYAILKKPNSDTDQKV